MSNALNLSEILGYKAKQLCSALGLPKCHPVSKGDLSEIQWINFLKSFLPNRYDVAKGFVFDSKGSVSEQIDIIIFDPFHSPLIYEAESGEKYVTAESVYAVFEVKQKANKENLKYSQDKIESVKRLHRTSRRMIASGKTMSARNLTNIIGGLLATNSIAPKSSSPIYQNLTISILCALLRRELFISAMVVFPAQVRTKP